MCGQCKYVDGAVGVVVACSLRKVDIVRGLNGVMMDLAKRKANAMQKLILHELASAN